VVTELVALETAVSPADRFREYLATQGMRLTPEREAVVEDVFSSHEHFDAEQLAARLAQRRVSRSSVYRALALLVEAGLLRKVVRTNNREVYEHDYGYPQHDHLVCKKCGSLTEFPHAELTKILEDVARQHNFRMESHRLEVYGTCAECSRPPRRGHRKLDMI
jgi:Fur family ferric uptake transcriptional regulator